MLLALPVQKSEPRRVEDSGVWGKTQNKAKRKENFENRKLELKILNPSESFAVILKTDVLRTHCKKINNRWSGGNPLGVGERVIRICEPPQRSGSEN